MVINGGYLMKKQLLIFGSLQIVCNIVYTLLTKLYHVVFVQQSFWTSFIGYAEIAVGLLETAIILISIAYIGACIKSFWKMTGTVALYLVAIYLIEFALQWGVGLYGFVPLSYLLNVLFCLIKFCAFACVYFLFQKFILKNYIIP
jgi:hypothetical protein